MRAAHCTPRIPCRALHLPAPALCRSTPTCASFYWNVCCIRFAFLHIWFLFAPPAPACSTCACRLFCAFPFYLPVYTTHSFYSHYLLPAHSVLRRFSTCLLFLLPGRLYLDAGLLLHATVTACLLPLRACILAATNAHHRSTHRCHRAPIAPVTRFTAACTTRSFSAAFCLVLYLFAFGSLVWFSCTLCLLIPATTFCLYHAFRLHQCHRALCARIAYYAPVWDFPTCVF